MLSSADHYHVHLLHRSSDSNKYFIAFDYFGIDNHPNIAHKSLDFLFNVQHFVVFLGVAKKWWLNIAQVELFV